MSQIFTKQEVTSNSPLDVLDFSMIEGGGNPSKYQSQNGQDSLYQQLLSNTAKVSNKYIENDSTDKVDVPVTTSETSDDTAVPESKPLEEDSPTPTRNKIYECPYCPYKSTRSCNLTSHLQTHYLERPYADPSCTYCSTLNNYKIDRMSSNLENQMHPCSQCSEFSSSVEDAVKHLKSHLDESSCICTHTQRNETGNNRRKVDDKAFPKPKITSETPKDVKSYQCPTCTYVTHRPQNLKRHIVTHTGERPHSCTVCPYRAPNVSSLRVHMKTHTGERPYECPHCSYKAAQKSTLRNHLKIHTGEKPYPCTYCSYRSSIQTNLNSHIKTHTGERPYSCPHCSYCATQSSALKCHLRIHTGEKPFACSQCPYKAAALGNLRSHTLTHCH